MSAVGRAWAAGWARRKASEAEEEEDVLARHLASVEGTWGLDAPLAVSFRSSWLRMRQKRLRLLRFERDLAADEKRATL